MTIAEEIDVDDFLDNAARYLRIAQNEYEEGCVFYENLLAARRNIDNAIAVYLDED